MCRFVRKILSLLVALCIMTSVVPFSYAESETELKRYIVILEEPAVYSADRPIPFSSKGEEYHSEVRKALLELQQDVKAQIEPSMHLLSDDVSENEFSYTDVLNGFTITTDEKTAERIKTIEGVSEVFPDEVIAYADQTEKLYLQSDTATETEDEYSAANPGNEINVKYAYDKGYDGEGRVIAILDSTINYDNTYFKLSDETAVKYTAATLADKMIEKGIDKDSTKVYKTAKVPYVYDYVYNTYTIAASSQHGTHVSGIAAGYETRVGDGKITGIAPEAQIMFFGVTSSSGNISFSVAAAAIDDAVKLEADAINMSFGADYYSENRSGTAYTKFREAAQNAENAGCILSKSAGNIDKGNATQTKVIDYSASDNTLFPYVSNVGSVHGRFRVAKGLVDENGVVYGSESKSSVSKFELSDIVNCKSGTSEEINSQSVSGKVAVITVPDELLRESDLTYYNRVTSGGAVAMILVNNSNQVAVSSVSSYYNIPVFYMTKTEGEEMLANAKQISCIGKLTISGNSDDVVASNTSSYGYSDKLDISVDYSSPGGNIYSAYGSSFAGMSGTSMAAPGASAASILMYQYVEEKYPEYKGSEKVNLVKNLLASTAETIYEENGAIASPRKVGSGLIQLDKAMQSGVIIHNETNNNRITLGDEIGKEFTLNFYIRNISDRTITFDKVDVELSTDDYKYYESKGIYAFYGIKKLSASLDCTESVTVLPSNFKQVSLTVTLNDEDIAYLENAMVNGFFVDGKVILSNTAGEHPSVGIPFTGFFGDWEKYTPVNEENMNSDFLFRTEMDYCTVDNIILQSENGYILPFTTEPDEFVKDSALSHLAKIRKNTFIRIKADGNIIYNGFVQKNNSLNLNTFVMKNGAVSETLKKNGKVVWEFYFMSPLHKTESEAQVITITVLPQNIKPSFREISLVESGGKKYLHTYTEGEDVSAIICIGRNEDGTEKVSRVYNNSFAAFSVDDFADASLVVYDSALNSAVENPGITVSLENDAVVFKNNTFNDIPGIGIIGVYDEKGRVDEIKILTDEYDVIKAYQKVQKDISVYKDRNYKIFFWEKSKISPYGE